MLLDYEKVLKCVSFTGNQNGTVSLKKNYVSFLVKLFFQLASVKPAVGHRFFRHSSDLHLKRFPAAVNALLASELGQL